FLLYLIGTLYLLPLYIKGPLAAQLSRRLDRPVSVDEVIFSPFSFNFRLNGISIGADSLHLNEPELCGISAIETHISFDALLQGKVVLADVQINRMQANLIRYVDGSYTSLVPKDSGSGIPDSFALLPNWLQVQGIQLTKSRVHFLDQANDRKHLVEQIEFILPVTAQGQRLEPTLKAVIDSSPVLIRGEQHVRNGITETRISLELNDIDPQKYLAWVPGMAQALRIEADKADAVLEVIFQDSVAGPTVSGTVMATSLLIQSKNQEKASEAFRLVVPKARIVIQAAPLQNLYTIEELVMDAPQLRLQGSKEVLHGEALAAKVSILLNAEKLGLAIKKLSLQKGSTQTPN
ncbi:MAG: hypothetical protein D3923_19640, partial [Candidatus Electrothrix sp. AR3]|nr:hypothetical protein [Candidatus Electrothrix sp. AR3]